MRFWCSLPTADTSSFVPLELRVTAASSGAPRYSRVIQINEVGKFAGSGRGTEGGLCLRPLELPFSAVLLDPPAELEARRADEGGHVVLRWLPPPGAPMASLIRYEVNISAGGAPGSAQKVRLAPTAHPQLSQRSSPSKSRPDGHHGLAPPGLPLTPDIPLPWGPRRSTPTHKTPFSKPPQPPKPCPKP